MCVIDLTPKTYGELLDAVKENTKNMAPDFKLSYLVSEDDENYIESESDYRAAVELALKSNPPWLKIIVDGGPDSKLLNPE
jgi:hypothetical protein